MRKSGQFVDSATQPSQSHRVPHCLHCCACLSRAQCHAGTIQLQLNELQGGIFSFLIHVCPLSLVCNGCRQRGVNKLMVPLESAALMTCAPGGLPQARGVSANILDQLVLQVLHAATSSCWGRNRPHCALFVCRLLQAQWPDFHVICVLYPSCGLFFSFSCFVNLVYTCRFGFCLLCFVDSTCTACRTLKHAVPNMSRYQRRMPLRRGLFGGCAQIPSIAG